MKHLHCKMFGHSFYVSRHVTDHVKEYTCENCSKKLTTNGSGHLIELTPKFREINDVLQHIHFKRYKKSNKKTFSNLLDFSH